MIDDDIMAVPTVHLASLGAELVQLDPVLLCRLPVEVPCVLEISAGIHVHTIVLVVLNVDGRDDSSSSGDGGDKMRESLRETLQNLDEIATGYVIRKDKVACRDVAEGHVRDIETLVQAQGKPDRKIGVRKSIQPSLS